jgi:hypothetical protein
VGTDKLPERAAATPLAASAEGDAGSLAATGAGGDVDFLAAFFLAALTGGATAVCSTTTGGSSVVCGLADCALADGADRMLLTATAAA